MTWRLLHDSVWWALAVTVTLTTGSIVPGLVVVGAVVLIEDMGL